VGLNSSGGDGVSVGSLTSSDSVGLKLPSIDGNRGRPMDDDNVSIQSNGSSVSRGGTRGGSRS
jgi:hypothetical protein